MGLKEYFKKRTFGKTPEPKGKKHKGPGKKLRFVVQKHHASQLHYDFRLEMDGVLKSWAVPKGPSMNPHDHHLAMHVEDHPYDYRKFEGVIPEGNYGAGNVIIWDEGWYEARADSDNDEKLLLKELKKGHITFILHGKKLRGEFALIKMPNAKEEGAWLLIKKADEYATAADITQQDTSVKSNRRVDDLGAYGKLPNISEYPKVSAPWQVKPMLCTLVDEPFNREGWLFEIKWDGYRAIATKHRDEIELYSRNHNSFLHTYTPVTEALHELNHDVILDGEIVIVDKDGVSHFEWLQNWGRDFKGTIQYQVFDILWCDGRDLRTMPLIERKAFLKALLPRHSVLKYSDHIETKGEALFGEMRRRGLEGVVAKQADSPYKENDRGAAWLKIKTQHRQEVVIGGFTEPRGSRKYLGSLLVGVYEGDELVYTGHSGGGIGDVERKKLYEKLLSIERKNSPFTTTPRPNAPVHWVKPELVCEMAFSEWTSDGYMRHPEFKGLRVDKDPAKITKEEVKHMSQSNNKLPFEPSHLDKVFFPKTRYTKGDLFHYYETMADYILPYIKDRPLSLNRMPDGIKGQSFYQKNNPHLPDWVPHADIFSDSNNEDLRWIVGGRLDTLLYTVQLGAIEVNPWNAQAGRLKHPDWIVIDLDPEGVNFETVIEVAHTVKAVCDEWHIPAYPKTSGKTGIHIFIPMAAKYTFDQARNLAHLIVLEVNERQPKITSVERNPEKRPHKVYLDWLQNREGQTLAAPYSVRPTAEATVSMPLHWHEVKKGLKPSQFTIKNALSRVKRTGDLWEPVVGKGVDLKKTLAAIEKTHKLKGRETL